MRIYVASSWRNKFLSANIGALRKAGHSVYDFREDDGQGSAFNWQDIDPAWQDWTPEQFMKKVNHPKADRGFQRDARALQDCDALLLILPCGRSAHLELGFAIGLGKPTVVMLDEKDFQPELMYRLAGGIYCRMVEVLDHFKTIEEDRDGRFTREKRDIRSCDVAPHLGPEVKQ